MRKSAFTLIELLVVIAILGIIATIVTLQVSGAQIRARNTAAQTDIAQGGKAIETWYTNTNSSTYVSSVVVNATHTGQTTQLTGSAALGGWTAMFTAAGTYTTTISRTPSIAYTYVYVSDSAIASSLYCLATNAATPGTGFAVVNGTSRFTALAAPTYSASSPTVATICQ